jgi:hypothetical protein
MGSRAFDDSAETGFVLVEAGGALVMDVMLSSMMFALR